MEQGTREILAVGAAPVGAAAVGVYYATRKRRAVAPLAARPASAPTPAAALSCYNLPVPMTGAQAAANLGVPFSTLYAANGPTRMFADPNRVLEANTQLVRPA